jgi:hypothetical protein
MFSLFVIIVTMKAEYPFWKGVGMKNSKVLSRFSLLAYIVLFLCCSAGCAQNVGLCPIQPYVDLSNVENYMQDDSLPFRFPLDDVSSYWDTSSQFCKPRRNRLDGLYTYHAAEDYHQPAGTPVYAMADGEVSFTGPMGGYGWLVIIDHPQANLYSLYGHLSPSRWRIKKGPVARGQLIAYLGDDDENGGSREQPLEPHLHFGIRAGQRMDYPANGEWRWMGGWIHPCPADVGWLRPSAVIAEQNIPAGGFREPDVDFLTLWGVETLFGLIYLAGGIGVFVFATRKKKFPLLILGGLVMGVAGWIFYKDGWRISPLMLVLAVILLSSGIYRLVKK